MAKGTIKTLSDRGFGFIRGENGTEYFFHRSAVEGVAFEQLREGQPVEFEVEPSQRGPRARDVRPE